MSDRVVLRALWPNNNGDPVYHEARGESTYSVCGLVWDGIRVGLSELGDQARPCKQCARNSPVYRLHRAGVSEIDDMYWAARRFLALTETGQRVE